MALATNPAQQTTTMKGVKPGFEAMHREDWLADWSRDGPSLDMQQQPRTGSREADNSAGPTQLQLVSGVVKVTGRLAHISYPCRSTDSASHGPQSGPGDCVCSDTSPGHAPPVTFHPAQKPRQGYFYPEVRSGGLMI